MNPSYSGAERGATGLLQPWQDLLSGVGVKPMSQSQRCPPGVLRHWPFSQRSTLSAHSSTSAGQVGAGSALQSFVGSRPPRHAGLTRAGVAVPSEALGARAPVGARHVLTFGTGAAPVCPAAALVHICAARDSRRLRAQISSAAADRLECTGSTEWQCSRIAQR